MPKPPMKDFSVVVNGVEILFSWRGDRWSHAIHFRGGADAATWRSIEGSEEGGGDAAWPASPVIVELSPVPTADAVVGVGRSGKSHYSVSFTAKPADESELGILVECACRIHEPPGWLGSTYEQAGPAGTPARIVRIPAMILPGVDTPLPLTVTWSYVVGPTGPVPCHGPG